VFGFLLAYLMYKPFRGQAFFYIIFILPMLTVPVVVAYTAEMMLYQSGPINDLISRIIGIDFKPAWLSNPDIALATVALLEIWNWTPFSFIILLAGLSAIPKEPIEAAEILGASKWRIFWEVQLPLLRPVILLALVLRFLEAMAEFPKTWALFQGGPGSATETLPIYIFMTTWQYFQISKGAAMSYIVMLLMIVIVLIAIHLLRRENACKGRGGLNDGHQIPPSSDFRNRSLCDPEHLGCRCLFSDLLDGLNVIQAGHPMVRVAAGLFSGPADADQLHECLARRRAI
jgi:multiple sugar transport system permease protein